MATPPGSHTATLLRDGRLLVAGGDGPLDSLSSAEIWSLQPNGTGCDAHLDCLSGSCTDGVCCDHACNAGACEACSEARGATADGTCTPLHPECSPFACDPASPTGACETRCETLRDCAAGYACAASGACVPASPASYLDDGGCALAPADAGRPAGVGLAILAALSLVRRRGRTVRPPPA